MRALEGKKGHDVFLTSDDMSDEKMRRARGLGYAEGMSSSTFCWIPRGDNPTSRRIFDAVAAGRVPVVVSDDIARYLPFRWAVDWRAMMLQVPEKVFAKHPEEVAEAVLATAGRRWTRSEREWTTPGTLLWNDREAPEETCGGRKRRRARRRVRRRPLCTWTRCCTAQKRATSTWTNRCARRRRTTRSGTAEARGQRRGRVRRGSR